MNQSVPTSWTVGVGGPKTLYSMANQGGAEADIEQQQQQYQQNIGMLGPSMLLAGVEQNGDGGINSAPAPGTDIFLKK